MRLLTCIITTLAVAGHHVGAEPTGGIWAFSGHPAGVPDPAVFATEGMWEVADGAARNVTRTGSLRPSSAAWQSVGRLEAVVRVASDARPAGGWRIVALQLRAGASDSWDLGLVIGPDGRRYGELVERHAGVWQAQNEFATRLEVEPGQFDHGWELGDWYRFSLTLDTDSVRGEIAAVENGRVVFSRAYRLATGVPAVRGGRPSLRVDGLWCEIGSIQAEHAEIGRPPLSQTIAVLTEAMPGVDQSIAGAVADDLDGTWEILRIAASDLDTLHPEQAGTLVLPEAGHLPGRAAGAITRYLAAGGRLLAIGGPLLETRYVQTAGEWVTTDEALSRLRAEAHLPYLDDGLDGWTRTWGILQCESTWEPIRGPDGSAGVRVSVRGLDGWDTYGLAVPQGPFAEGRSVTCFAAKGSERTRQLLIEWKEADGTRWIATVELGNDWRHYALPADAFEFWPDPRVPGRGGPEDRMRPDRVVQFSVGIAFGHADGGLDRGDHEWSIAGLGTAVSPVSAEDLKPVALECLSPWYKYHRLPSASGVRLTPEGAAIGLGEPAPEGPVQDAVCAIGRYRGGCWAGGAPSGRFMPVLEAVSGAGEWRGNLAFVYQSLDGPTGTARWAQLGVAYDHRFAPVVRTLVSTLLQPVLLSRAGVDQWAYHQDEAAPQLGARVTCLGAASGVSVRFTVTAEGGRGVAEVTRELPALSSGDERFVDGGKVENLAPGFYTVRTELRSHLGDGRSVVVDTIEQQFSVHSAEGSVEGRVRLSDDGTRFEADGKPFYPHGCNYWPLYVAGLDSTAYWSHWLAPDQYDPVAVERDLALLERLGGNLVSIQYVREDQAAALVDFLARCRRHAIRANIFLISTHPLSFDPPLTRRMLQSARLAGNPAVFAYDLAWEPHLGSYERRIAYDQDWRQWLLDNYGSIERAEATFGMAVPRREDGEVTGPSDAQLVNEGPHRVLVCAYRRFVDDLVSYGYGEVKAFIRDELGDPTLLGARTGYGGTGQLWVQQRFPYDLVSGAAHLDFTSPEGYGIDGEWRNFRNGGFTTQYGRWAGNGKPVFWAEFGRSVYSPAGPTPQALEAQAQLYENTYRMVLESRADGSACWWWPGGYRVDETSDYGIISPDGTPRDSALTLARFSAAVTSERPLSKPDVWIEIDRDRSCLGYAGVWLAHMDEYAQAIEGGRWVGLRTEASGTTTADFPRVSIGNVPWEPGLPLKHLGGELHRLRLSTPDSARTLHSDPGELLPAGLPVSFTVDVTNTGEVRWLAGDVSISAESGGVQVAETPITSDLARYDTVSVSGELPALDPRSVLTLRLRVLGEPFGVPLRLAVADE